MFPDSAEHSAADLVIVMKGEFEVGPVGVAQKLMRAGLALDAPAIAKERGQDTFGLSRRPLAH